MIAKVFEDKLSLSLAAAKQAANAVRRAILDRGRARISAATGTSQLDFLDALTGAENIDWRSDCDCRGTHPLHRHDSRPAAGAQHARH